MFYIEKFRGGP